MRRQKEGRLHCVACKTRWESEGRGLLSIERLSVLSTLTPLSGGYRLFAISKVHLFLLVALESSL